MELAVGDSLQRGKYTIEGLLGQGRFAKTYLARRSDGERRVIKVLNEEILAGLDAAECDRLKNLFWQEANILARCDGQSPYIVRIDTPFEKDGMPCLPLEYVGGTSLAKRAQQILPEPIALEYIRQIGEAVKVLHGEQLVHRDIRPDNIFLRDCDGRVEAVLTDFGLALEFDTELSRTRTQERIKGFSALELFTSGQSVGPYTDVYSLAATLYEMLTGEVPVSADERKARGTPLVTPQQKNPEISAKTVNAILKGLELEREKRPQSVVAWLQALGIAEVSEPPTKQLIDWAKWGVIWAAAAVIVSVLTWAGDHILSQQGSGNSPVVPTQTTQP
jgi:serine/threonine protein kinase